MKNEDLLKESIHLILNYHGRSIIVELKKYKTLVHVKQKVFDLFFPVKHNINIYLNNKNLEPLISQPIGYIFSGQSLVNLKVVDEGVINTPFKLVNRYQDSFYTTNDLMTNYSRQNFNFYKKASKTNSTENKLSKSNSKNNNKSKTNKSAMLNKNKLFLLKSELNNINKNKINNKRLFNSGSVDNINTKKYQTGRNKLPPIQPKIIKNKKSNNANIVYNKCNDCYINKIAIYCRLCDKFLCNNCALNKKSYHISHKDDFITLIQDSNKANIKQYRNIINKQLKESLVSFNNIDKNKNKEKNEEEEDNNNNEKSDNNNDNEKINENDNDNDNEKNNDNEKFNYNDIITKISEHVYKLVDQAKEMKDNIKNIDFSQNNDDDERIHAIIENEKKVLKKLDVFEYVSPFQPFFILNTYERNMHKYFNNYGVSNDERIYIKTQIELMFENVENEVDNTLAEIDKIIGDKKL